MSNLKSQLEYYCRIPRIILTLMGQYPTKAFKYDVKRMILWVMGPIYFLYTTIYSAIIQWRDMIELTVNICASAACIVAIFKFINTMMKRELYYKLLKTIEQEFWSQNETSLEDEKNIILNFGRLCQFLTTVQLVTVFAAGPVWIIEPILKMNGIVQRGGNMHELILPFELWVPFGLDIHSHPLFDILYAVQFIVIVCTIVVFLGTDALFMHLILNLCGQFRLLQYRLKNFTKIVQGNKKQELFLHKCIEFHQDLCTYCNEIEDANALVFLLQFFLSAMFLCLSGLSISLYKENTYNYIRNIIFIIAAIWELFIICYVAELLTTEFCNVSHAAYESQWTECSNSVKKLIIIIIMRAQKPFYLTAWKFTNANLESFVMVLRAAVSYFTVFNSVDLASNNINYK